MRLPIALLLSAASAISGSSAPGSMPNTGTAIACIDSKDPLHHASTEEMTAWLASYAKTWEPGDSFSIAAPGAMGRLFLPNGRAIHPAELAAIVSGQPKFTGKKRELVWLGVSESELSGDKSYAARLAKRLGTKVQGCAYETYFMSNGIIFCGAKPIRTGPESSAGNRVMPIGFALNGAPFLMLFCSSEKAAISPKSMLSSAVAYGLFPEEVVDLKARSADDPVAAFRLYQYYWLALKDPKQAKHWLKVAADLGHDIARFNLAYELLEADDPGSRAQADVLLDGLAQQGFAGPDLRKYY